tara:strand:- start:1067 stop:1285 length:219 start_codon:yes stop_codon:yes gene_type:complete
MHKKKILELIKQRTEDDGYLYFEYDARNYKPFTKADWDRARTLIKSNLVTIHGKPHFDGGSGVVMLKYVGEE